MTIIFTNSHDGTTDLLLGRLPVNAAIFRLNFDLFSSYDITITPTSFHIKDPAGRIASDETVTKAYYRKPTLARHPPGQQDYLEGENWTALRALICQLWESSRLTLVEPFLEKTRLNKIRQLRLAAQYFKTVRTVFSNSLSSLVDFEQAVVKSLNGGNLGNKTLYARRVEVSSLRDGLPWYMQEFVPAQQDLTVVYVHGRCWGFTLDRQLLAPDAIDCRSSEELWDRWHLIDLPSAVATKINALMNDFSLLYGRLDFLISPNGEYVFCEVNSNGQFAWLDPEDQHGLLSAIAAEINPETPLTSPVPFR